MPPVAERLAAQLGAREQRHVRRARAHRARATSSSARCSRTRRPSTATRATGRPSRRGRAGWLRRSPRASPAGSSADRSSAPPAAGRRPSPPGAGGPCAAGRRAPRPAGAPSRAAGARGAARRSESDRARRRRPTRRPTVRRGPPPRPRTATAPAPRRRARRRGGHRRLPHAALADRERPRVGGRRPDGRRGGHGAEHGAPARSYDPLTPPEWRPRRSRRMARAAARGTVASMSATEPLSPLDATFLELEDADVTAHMHIGGVLVFDPLPGGARPRSRALRRHLERRLDALPRYRQRLSQPHDRRPALAGVGARRALRHRRARHPRGAPSAGGERELLAWAADFWSHRLDRGRPAVAHRPARGPRRRALGARDQDPPLPRGRRGLDRRGHGAARRRAEARARWTPPARTHPAQRRRQRRRAAAPGRRADGGGRGGRRRRCAIPGAPPRRSTPRARCVELLVRDELVAAPHTSLNVPLSEHRRHRRHRGAARGDQGDQARAGRDGQRRRPRRSSPQGCASCSSSAGRTRPPRACVRWCP